MNNESKYAVSKSVPRELTAKQVRTLNDLFSYTPGLWNDGLALAYDVKDYKGFYPTYEGMAATLKRFPEYKLLGSDISQQILKNTLGTALKNLIKALKGETQANFRMPKLKRQSESLPLMVPIRKIYLDEEARTVTVPMSNAYKSILRSEAKTRYDAAKTIASAFGKAKKKREKYLDAAVKAYRKAHPNDKIKISKLRRKFERELDKALEMTQVPKNKFVSAYIEARKVTLNIPERVDINTLQQIGITQHRHGQYFSIEWKEKDADHGEPEAPAELPQALAPTPSVAKAIQDAIERREAVGECDRIDATIDLNVKNLISCTLLSVRYEYEKQGKRKKPKLVEVATPFYSFVIDGGWLLSIYRATAKDAAKLTSEMDSWKNIYDDEAWQEKKKEIEERTDEKKQPTRCRRQRHVDAVRNKRKGRYENGKRRADVAIDIIVKDAIAIMGCAGVTRVCVGHNLEQKKKSKLKHGSVASQAFQAINYTRIRNRIEHWCGMFGWEYAEAEESYTSKISAYDMENLPSWDGKHHPEYVYVGKRVRRGLFKTADGTIINADVNGALNIWRKCSLNGRLDRAERLAGVYHPYRVSAEVKQAA